MTATKTARVGVAVTLVAAMLALSAAPAAASCPSPGTGYAGAANMAAGDAGMAQAMDLIPAEAHEGMHGAVANSAC